MKVGSYSPKKQVILGDLGETPKDLPKLTADEIFKMQPASTQQLMRMAPDETFIISDDWLREKDAHKVRPDLINENGDLTDKAAMIADEKRDRDTTPFYKKDVTPIIINGETRWDLDPDQANKIKRDIVISTTQTNMDVQDYKASIPTKEEWRELTWWEALLHWLKGGDVRADND